MSTNTNILTVNAGSSSLKIALFDQSATPGGFERRLSLTVSNIGQPTSHIVVTPSDGSATSQTAYLPDHAAAATAALHALSAHLPDLTIGAVAHRLVHGGPRAQAARLIDEQLITELTALAALDPQHTPAALQLIREFQRQFADCAQVACFDTAFFHDLPRVATIVPIARQYQRMGVRRYGFHGLSYEYVLAAFRAAAGQTAANGRLIIAHLGSGASLAALHDGRPVDTTMGFSPASGIMMSSRAGDLDPNLVTFLAAQGVDSNTYDHMVNFESGLLGVSGRSADMLELLEHEAEDQAAAEAVELFCYQVKKAVATLTASLGGLDSLIFCGGIGEQSAVIRQRICAGLDYLGMGLDEQRNQANAELISGVASQKGVHVIATNEALVLCKQASALLTQKG